ncbi:hypothetical protein Hanom_Chr13g01221731 [Helianthus anomalus]
MLSGILMVDLKNDEDGRMRVGVIQVPPFLFLRKIFGSFEEMWIKNIKNGFVNCYCGVLFLLLLFF